MFVVFRVHVRVTFSYSNLHDITKSPLKNLRNQSAAAGVSGYTELVCMTIYMQVWGNYCTCCLLTQHWLNLSVLAEECTALVCMTVYIQVWGNGCTCYLLTQHWLNLKSFGWGMHCTCTYDSIHTGVGKWLYMLPSHPTLAEFQSFGRGTLTNNNRTVIKDCPSVTIMLSPMFQVIRKQWIQPQLFSFL